MRDPALYVFELTTAAPATDPTMLRVLGRLLAMPAPVDVLLNVTDALKEATTELVLDGRIRAAAELIAIGAVIDRAAHSRRGVFW